MKTASIIRRPPTEGETEGLFSSFLFSGIGREERKKALSVLPPLITVYPQGERIVTARESFSSLGIVCEGVLSITREGEARRVIHRRLTKGEVFGVSSLFLESEPFPTTVEAESTASVLLLSEEAMTALFEAVPATAKAYIALLTRKIRFLNRRLDTLAGRSAEERVAAHLLGSGEGAPPITRSALASLLGLGRASLYRILDLFEENGLVEVGRKSIVIKDRVALKNFIESRKEH